MDALVDAAPHIALLRAEIDAGLIRPDMDITAHILEAARIIMQARDVAAKTGGSTAKLISELLEAVDLHEGAIAPLTRALVEKMVPSGRQAPADKIAAFLRRYVDEARKSGRTGGLLDNATGPLDVLKTIDKATFGDLTETGTARVFEQQEPRIDVEAMPETAFKDGASSPEAVAGDEVIEGRLAERQTPKAITVDDIDPTRPQLVKLQDVEEIDAKRLDSGLRARQGFTTIDDMMAAAEKNHAWLDAKIEKIAARVGAKQKKAPLKARAKVEQRVHGKHGGKINRMKDIARGGVEVETPQISEAFVRGLSDEMVVIDEGWTVTPAGYFDGKLLVVFPDGQVGEVQLWAPGMLEAKEGRTLFAQSGHEIYDIWSSIDPADATRAPERAELAEKMSAIYAAVREPLDPSWEVALGRNDGSAPNAANPSLKRSASTSGEVMSEKISDDEMSSQDAPSSSKTQASDPDTTAGYSPSIRKRRSVIVDTPEGNTANMGGDALNVNDIELELPDGSTVTARELMADLDQDDTLQAVLDACPLGRAT